jgi:hypothetical protein
VRQIPEPYRETPQSTLPDGSLPPTLGPVFVAWAEAMLCHGEGDLLGAPYRVPLWLKRAAYRLLEFNPTVVDDVTRAHPFIVREVLIVCPKGAAKTEGMAALALFLLAGPSSPTPDGPVERVSPNIPIAAASWDQANKLFGNAATNMATGTADSPAALAPHVRCFESEIQLVDRPGAIYRVAAVAGTNDGGLPTAGFADELHEWTGRKARVHLVLFQGLDKRFNGLLCNITTPDGADPDSLLGQKITHAEKVASGEVVDPGFYYLRYSAPDGCALDTHDQVVAAVDAAHPAEWIDPKKIARKLLVDRIPVHEFRRYWLGQFVRGGGHWLPEGSWEERSVGTWEQPGDDWPEAGERVVLAFDGSYRRDSTGIIGCTLDGHEFVVAAWERPDDAPESWKVPRTEVKAVMAEAMRRWEVVELAPDPPGWHDEIETWESTYGEVVVRFDTNQISRMAPACSRFYAAVAGGSDDDDPGSQPSIPLTHGGHPALARHLRNAVVKKTASGDVITKAEHSSPHKIDLAIGAVVAYERACWHATTHTPPVPAPRTARVTDPSNDWFRPTGRLSI